ncbi:MAG: nickel-dependent lactate racemase [Planctomycetaceae bacterium]
MQIELRCGRGSVPVSLPDDADVTVIRKPPMPVISSPPDAVAAAFAQPVESPPLRELARGANSACIAVCDITRPVPNHLFLRPLIETLIAGGISPDRIQVLIATGLHRPNEGDELKELIGDPWVLENVSVVNHFARDDAQHVHLGNTRTRGTVVRLDRRFVEADLRIATGLVEPHFMAGYSGGRKVIAPGLAHAETITTFHSARFMADPAATSCNFAGNPLHEEQLEIVRLLGGALAVNTVIDEFRRLSFVNFGEVIASHQAAVSYVRKYCEVPVGRRFHTVITSAAGYPLDRTYYQTVKGMVTAIDILEPGGSLIIVSDCSEGMGSAEFTNAQKRLRALGPQAFLNSLLLKSHAEIDEWQTQMQLRTQAIGNVFLHSHGLSADEFELTGVQRAESLDSTIRHCMEQGADNAVAVIPEGPYVVPFCDHVPEC